MGFPRKICVDQGYLVTVPHTPQDVKQFRSEQPVNII